jgi:GMP synthase (glutamine-hydrolysing)
MNIHYFQHVPFEGLGSIEPWLIAKSARVSATKFFEGSSLPEVQSIDWLIVMGGPMGVNDEQMYPWLHAEKKFIAEAIENGKNVLGICLGAQLIASAMGANVYPNRHREIGWFPVDSLVQQEHSGVINIFPKRMDVFHWHGDTFDLPVHATHLARSEGCENQAFCIGERIVGLQFHLEATAETVTELLEHSHRDLVAGRYVQSAAEMFSDSSRFHRINAIMDSLLEHWSRLGSH